MNIVGCIIINMTPHAINIVSADGKPIRTIPASGQTIRLTTKTVRRNSIDGIPTSFTSFGNPVGLPEYVTGTIYIVSQLVKSAFPDRRDLFVPAEMVRDEAGRIIGCQSLGR